MTETCARCKGTGKVQGYACPGFRFTTFSCSACNGTGTVTDNMKLWREIGETMRACRQSRDKGQREFADWIGTDVVTLSKAEHGVIDPRPVNKLLQIKIDAETGLRLRKAGYDERRTTSRTPPS